MVQSSLTETKHRANDEKSMLNSKMQNDIPMAVLVAEGAPRGADGAQQQTCTRLQFWRPEVQGPGLSGPVSGETVS